MDSLPNVGDMVSWHDKLLNRRRFGNVVQVSAPTRELRVRRSDGKITPLTPVDQFREEKF